MINRIHKFIQKEELLEPDDRILLAISGGIDSMCLLDIFHQLPYSIGVAHVNHLLRGAESDEDQRFVEDVCAHLGVDYFTTSVDVKSIAKTTKKNISESGRAERYGFFNRICEEHGFTKVATAHHANDDIETVLMRILDGSGLSGLSGIPLVNGNVIRPLLRATREELEEFAERRAFAYREDSSNRSTTYFRNAIRHNIIPALTTLKSSAESGMIQSIDNIKDSAQLLKSLVKVEVNNMTTKKDNTIIIDIPSADYPGRNSLLYYCLEPYGFTRSQILDLAETPLSGSTFYSETYKGLYNRGTLIISQKSTQSSRQHAILVAEPGHIPIHDVGTLALSYCHDSELSSNSYTETIDADKISFPITVRHWKHGDSFSPIGMNGQSQSLQDFFTNKKLSKLEKEQVLLLESEGNIVWLIGLRLAEQVKVRKETTRYLKLEFIPNTSIKAI